MAIRDMVGGDNGKAWFEKDIEKMFLKRAMEDRREGGFFRPSGITQCARLNEYSYLACAPFIPPDLVSIRRMVRGTFNHEIWPKLFAEAKIKIIGGDNTDTLVTMENPTIAGHYDFVLEDVEKLKWLVEWKSTDWLNDNLSWEYQIQWLLYSHMLQIPRGFIVKQHPSTFDIHPIKREYDKKLAEEIIAWLLMIENCAHKRKMVEYDDKCGPKGSWKKTCNIYEWCHSEIGEDPWELVPKGVLK